MIIRYTALFLVLVVLGGCADLKLGMDAAATTSTSTNSKDSTESPTSTTTGADDATVTPTEDPETTVSGAGQPFECRDNDDCHELFACVEGLCKYDPFVECSGEPIELPVASPNVVLVLGKSRSMVQKIWDHDRDPETPDVTRWFSLHQGIESLVSGFDGSVRLGLTLVPSMDALNPEELVACDVKNAPEVPVSSSHGAAILQALPPAHAIEEIRGATPTRLGIAAAIDHLKAQGDDVSRAIILVTDSPANCRPEAKTPYERFDEYDPLVVGKVAEGASAGIPTFVVGVDIADAPVAVGDAPETQTINLYTQLNTLAEAGGVPQDDPERPGELFYNTHDQLELDAALEKIARRLVPCIIELDPIPYFSYLLEVTVGGVFIGDAGQQVRSCATEDGWQYVDNTYSQIRLCGQACVDLQRVGAVEVRMVCPDGEF